MLPSTNAPLSARLNGIIAPAPCSGAPAIASVPCALIVILVPRLSLAVTLAVDFIPVVVHGLVFCNTLHLFCLSLSIHTTSLLFQPFIGVYELKSLACVNLTLLSLNIGILTFCISASVVASAIVKLLGLDTSNTLATFPIGR